MAKQTLTEKKAALTKKCVEARKELFDTKRIVEAEIKKAHPGLEWYEELDELEKDPRYQVANARLQALCDAANIMGADIF